MWSPRAIRARAVRNHRFKSAYIFGAVCPQRDTGVALVMTRVSTEAMTLMLAEISQAVPAAAHAVVLLGRAGWHIANDLEVPANLTLLPLPPYSPELNAIERLWQVMRATVLSHRLFTDTTRIIEACCRARNTLIPQPERIRSACGYPWAMPVEIS
ncbi:Transposase [Azospirillum endophyticum]